MMVSPHRLTRQSGQALIELAIVLPVLLLLAVGVIDVGRYAYIAILIGNAARAGAAYAAQSVPQSADLPGMTTAAANDYQNNGQNPATLTVASTTTCGCDTGGSFVAAAACSPATCPAAAHWVILVNVTASGNFGALFPYPGIPSSLNISRTVTLTVAQN